jgi:3D (Asp-Asp-Asp) domain-containing protein
MSLRAAGPALCAAVALALAGCAAASGPAPAHPAPRTAPAPAPSPEVRTNPPPPPPLPAGTGAAGAEVARVVEMRSTAYCLRGSMRTGVPTREGMAAGDPAVLPLGSVVRVSHPDGSTVGLFVVMDTGGAVRGNTIDLWMASCAEARAWGRRAVRVEVLRLGRA